MTPEEFNQNLFQKTQQFKAYVAGNWPKAMGGIAIRFINGNFRAQGWQGSTFQPWAPLKKPRVGGSILRLTGHLNDSIFFNVQPGRVVVRTYTPYAKAHNEGYEGPTNVKAHTRTINTAKGVKTIAIKAFTKQMRLPKRQFMPMDVNDSPVLYEALKKETIRGLKGIFEELKTNEL